MKEAMLVIGLIVVFSVLLMIYKTCCYETPHPSWREGGYFAGNYRA